MATTRRLSWWLVAAPVVVVLVLMQAEPGTSQSNTTTTNAPIRSFCDRVDVMSPSVFFRNLNSTIDELRRQLSNERVYNAKAQNLGDADSVYGGAQCRKYLTAGECVACFDAAVAAVRHCISGNGAYVILDNCFFRYQNFKDYYDDPRIIEDVGPTALGICGDQSASEPTTFNEHVKEFISNIRVATPRTSDFYVASKRNIITNDNNATIVLYAIAQCVENTSKTICQNCLNTAYDNLYGCLPHTEGRAIDLGCFMRYSQTPFFQDNQTTNLTPFLTQGHSSKAGLIGGVIGGATLFLFIFAFLLWHRLRKRSKVPREDASELQGAVNYSYEDLQLATDNFSEKFSVGKGGFGEVYKAIIDEDNVVAVKKLKLRHGRAIQEFDNEVKLISHVRHKNLVRLLGWSSEGPNLLLVLEFLSKGSLDTFLWGEKRGMLNWKQRFDIIYGIARGLAHLHHEFHVKIIHRDIKSANILLDDDYQPKIADFGLARFHPEDQTHVSTKFAGTLGYTAPEYAIRGKLSEKVDTYSFGIVVLEIVSGRRCTDVNPESEYLLEHAWKLYENDNHIQLIDETLDSSEEEKEHMMKIIEIGLTCTQSEVTSRPIMSEVVLLLSGGRFLVRRQVSRHTSADTPADRTIHITLNQETKTQLNEQ